MQSRIKGGLFQGVDFLAVLYYLLLVAAGCICITAASFDEETADFFAFSHFYIKQYMWVTAVLVVALVVLLLDVRYYHMWAYPLYIIGIVVMIGVLIAGKEVNGAKSWIELGSLRIQPVEFVKIATALALARVMSNYSFSINRFGDLLRVGVIVGIPMLLTILQNDTGSGIVLGAFLFVLYREGLNKWLCIPILLIAALFIVSFLLTPMTLLVLLILICVASEAMMNGRWRSRIVYLASLALSAIVLSSFMGLIAPGTMDIYRSLLTVTLASLPIVAIYAYRTRLMNILLMAGLFVVSMAFVPATDYIFESVLKPHQQERILSYLGIVDKPQGIDYNVNQSKIAIGSGGLFGKGTGDDVFLKNIGAANTDLVFGVISEQFGLILALCAVFLILVLVVYASRCAATARSSYYVIAANSAAAMLVFQTTLNVLGAVDILPLTGVTFPFVSLGGSSMISCWGLLAFLKAADTRPNASFTLKLPKRIRGWIPPDSDRIYDDRYNGWYDDYDEDGYDDYDDYDDYAEYDDYEDYDDYDDYDDRYDDDRDGYRNHAYGRDAPPGREDLARDPGSWDDLIDGPLWPEGEDPLTGRPRTGESRRTERGRRP